MSERKLSGRVRVIRLWKIPLAPFKERTESFTIPLQKGISGNLRRSVTHPKPSGTPS
jgi:hypothetical protein